MVKLQIIGVHVKHWIPSHFLSFYLYVYCLSYLFFLSFTVLPSLFALPASFHGCKSEKLPPKFDFKLPSKVGNGSMVFTLKLNGQIQLKFIICQTVNIIFFLQIYDCQSLIYKKWIQFFLKEKRTKSLLILKKITM